MSPQNQRLKTAKDKSLKSFQDCCEKSLTAGETYLVLAKVQRKLIRIFSPKLPISNQTKNCTILSFGSCPDPHSIQINSSGCRRKRRSIRTKNKEISIGQRLWLDFDVRLDGKTDPTFELICPNGEGCKNFRYISHANGYRSREVKFLKSETNEEDLGFYKLRVMQSSEDDKPTELGFDISERPENTSLCRPDFVNCLGM